MNKREFLDKLGNGLSGMPKSDIEERLNFYGEMIDDRMDEGISEEEAVSMVGSAEEIAEQINSENTNIKKAKKNAGTKSKLKAWKIVLICLGSPIWISLAAAAFAIFVSVYAVIWSVMIALWAVPVSLAACLPMGIFILITQCIAGNVLSGLALLGIGIAASGISIFATYGCIWTTKGTWALSKLIVLWIRSWFIGKENAK